MAIAANVGNDENGCDVLRAHLRLFYVESRDADKRRPDLVDDIVHWIAALMTQYAGMVDPETGAPLPWWRARKMMAQQRETIAQAAYQRAPDAYRQRWETRTVEGFTCLADVPPRREGAAA
jgi:hypothetical protein